MVAYSRMRDDLSAVHIKALVRLPTRYYYHYIIIIIVVTCDIRLNKINSIVVSILTEYFVRCSTKDGKRSISIYIYIHIYWLVYWAVKEIGFLSKANSQNALN